MVWSDWGGASVKPLNWMSPPTVIEESAERIVVRKRGSGEEELEILLAETLSDVTHDMGSPDEQSAASKDGVEADLQGVAPGRAAALVRRGIAAGAARVANRRRTGGSDVPRRRRGVGGGRDCGGPPG